MQEKDFNDLIDKYLKDELNIEEKNNVDNWLEYITDHHASDRLTQLEKEEAERNISAKLFRQMQLPVSKPALITRFHPLFKIAASLLLVTILAFGFREQLKEYFDIDQLSTVSNHTDGITKSILSDGSIVWLKGKSKLVFPVRFKGGQRNVNLEGEALFEIAKDPAHPFVIRCGNLTARALGTSFNIRKDHSKVEVDVLTGRVFLSSNHAAAVTLHRRQKGIYSEEKKTIYKEVKPVIEIASLTRGTEYDMLFHDAKLADVIRRIQDKFEVRINVKKIRSYNTHITADFTDQSLRNTMNMMSEALNMDFDIEGQSVEIRNKNSEQAE